jgi:amino acid transporter
MIKTQSKDKTPVVGVIVSLIMAILFITEIIVEKLLLVGLIVFATFAVILLSIGRREK